SVNFALHRKPPRKNEGAAKQLPRLAFGVGSLSSCSRIRFGRDARGRKIPAYRKLSHYSNPRRLVLKIPSGPAPSQGAFI
ncbi:MAG TPA: hypothetical protein VFQ82_15815, partial [Stellaceae bacterium]|nr:hypothetical protein [Stellaceae bacterium]